MQIPKRHTTSGWSTDYTVYPTGRVLIDTDTGIHKIADGVRWFSDFNLPAVWVGPDIFSLLGNPSSDGQVPTASAAAASGLVWATPSGGAGGITRSVSTISTTVTLGAAALTDYVAFLAASAVPTLPTAVSNTNKYTLKNIDTTNKTIATTSSQTIESLTTYTIQPNAAIELISDGANWRII